MTETVQEKVASRSGSSVLRGFLIVLGAACGGTVGAVLAAIYSMVPNTELEFLAIYSPLPHHVPEEPEGLSLRFAMVHDVIHERFARHSDEYYIERNRQAQEKLDQLSGNDPARWSLIDDLCVGLDRLGQPAEAIPVMREKLASQKSAGLEGLDLYTSYANLGTFLIHANFQRAQAGEKSAIISFEEGLDLIQRATEVNPNAHFGREKWQLEIATFLLHTFSNPHLLKETDCIGNQLDLFYDEIMNSDETYFTGFGKASTVLHSSGVQYKIPEFFPPEGDLNDPEVWVQVNEVRKYITKVGDEVNPVPFDEPVLGIIGMWREGGGANPHFSLALAETMLRVGQRYIAWSAYERTSQLADRYSSDPALQSFLRDFCEQRQQEIEASLQQYGPVLSPAIHPEYEQQQVSKHENEVVDAQTLREEFESELAEGLSYQQAFRSYEAAQIKAGAPFDSPTFYAEFHKEHPIIATKPGREELMYYVPHNRRSHYMTLLSKRWTFFGTALGTFCASLLIYLWSLSYYYEQRKH